eukprot:gene9934-10984_t
MFRQEIVIFFWFLHLLLTIGFSSLPISSYSHATSHPVIGCLLSRSGGGSGGGGSGSGSGSNRRSFLCMKWVFSKGQGPYRDLGGIGSNGEYYFIPSKKPSLEGPKEALGKETTLPLMPRNQVLCPVAEEYMGIYEMRYRQLINNVGEGGVFGHIYFSQENAKLALVGTLAKVKKIERLEDGGMYVLLEGVGKFFMKQLKGEKPYLRARVQIFQDYSEAPNVLDSLESDLLQEVRYSIKLMKLLYPQNVYTINPAVLKNRPMIYPSDVRPVSLPGVHSEMERRSKFTYANMDMLKTDPVTKLLFLQQPILEKRLTNMLKVMRQSTSYLENELQKRGTMTPEQLSSLRQSALADTSDLDLISKNSWNPDNFVNGEWQMQALAMD